MTDHPRTEVDDAGIPSRSGAAARTVRWLGLPLGPVAALATYVLLALVHDLSPDARAAAAVASWMAVWWLTEAIPMASTALLPLVLFPLTGVLSVRQAAAAYADPVIFLFMGGFLLGLAMERSGLHRRIALLTVRLVGARPRRVVLGFLLAAAALSAWVSNTATAVMMTPIGVSVIDLVFRRLGRAYDPADTSGRPGANFARCLLLGIAYGASIGGVATLIGTPPNIIFAGQARNLVGDDVGFVQWMYLGVPLALVLAPLVWAFLVYIAFPITLKEIPGGGGLIREELAALGPVRRAEWTVLAVFGLTALGWLIRPQLQRWLGLPGLDDTVIAMIGALSLFVIPVDASRRVFAMDWATAAKMPWGILLLFGGGLSLAAAVSANGLDSAIGNASTALAGLHPLLLVAIVTLAVTFLTELTSNTALATAILPVLAAAAVGLGVHPFLLMIPATLAASLAFMMPIATPPNAIVFASGYITLPQMVKAGLWLNILKTAVIVLFVYFAGSTLLGVDMLG